MLWNTTKQRPHIFLFFFPWPEPMDPAPYPTPSPQPHPSPPQITYNPIPIGLSKRPVAGQVSGSGRGSQLGYKTWWVQKVQRVSINARPRRQLPRPYFSTHLTESSGRWYTCRNWIWTEVYCSSVSSFNWLVRCGSDRITPGCRSELGLCLLHSRETVRGLSVRLTETLFNKHKIKFHKIEYQPSSNFDILRWFQLC